MLEQAQSDRDRFAFSHALVRRTLLERLSRAHRRRIHARVAEALQASRGQAALPEIAYHLCEAIPAADREHALDYATRAAEQATADLAYAEAVDLFTRALSLLPHEHDRRRILALKRALAYQALTHVMMDTPSAADAGRSNRRLNRLRTASKVDLLWGDVPDDLVDVGHDMATDALRVLT